MEVIRHVSTNPSSHYCNMKSTRLFECVYTSLYEPMLLLVWN
jgi:hypothetical protein